MEDLELIDKREQLKLLKQLFRPQNEQNRSFIELRLHPRAIQFVIESGIATSICSLDFAGYLFPIHGRYKVNGMLDIFGNFGLYSINKKKPIISKRIERKVLKHLIKTNFLYLTIEPFPEFSFCHNIPLDLETTQFVDVPIFTNKLSEEQLNEMMKLYAEIEE